MTSRMRRLALRGHRLRVHLINLLSKLGFKEDYYLIAMSIAIGGATGVGAHVFYMLIEQAQNLFYGHGGSGGLYGGRLLMLALLPAIGALLVGLITSHFAREAKGHGVPEVMDAMYREGGIIRPRVSVAKAISSALTIGSGGSAGTEGPIIQIGAAIGSTFGQFLRVSRRQMNVLVACGVAGGIASIFNAPIAGVLFALEIFLKDFSFKTFSPVVFASVLAGSLTHAFRGDRGIFETGELEQHQYLFTGAELPLYAVLGVICAGMAVLFIRTLYLTEDLSDKLRISPTLKPAIGAVLLGVLGIVYCLVATTHELPPFFGNGYPAIRACITKGVSEFSPWVLLAIALLKVAATCFTLGSGGSGGIFAPSLLMGAGLGGAFGLFLSAIGWVDPSHVAAYALVGMAALTAGTTHAPLTAIVILYEMTREPLIILPVMFAAIVSTFGAQFLLRDSIYTLKLRRRGIRVGTLADLTILKRITVNDLEVRRAPTVDLQDPLQKLLERAAETDNANFVVVDEEGSYQGLVVADDVKTALLQPEAVPLLLVEELVRNGVPTVKPNDTLDQVLDIFARNEVPVLAVSAPDDEQQVEGLITWQTMMDRYHVELDRELGEPDTRGVPSW